MCYIPNTCNFLFTPVQWGRLDESPTVRDDGGERRRQARRVAGGPAVSRGRRESDWLVARRCLAVVRRAQRGPADWRALLEAVLAQEGDEAYGSGPEGTRRLRLEKDLERIRGHLGVDLYYDRELGGYAIREAGLPLLDLPDEDLATIAWLAETFTPESPQHDAVQALLARLRRALPAERRAEIERHHTALAAARGGRVESLLQGQVRQRDCIVVGYACTETRCASHGTA